MSNERKHRALRPRDLVLDNLGSEAILVERVKAPSPKWLARQSDTRLRACGRARWWSALWLSGGAGLAPERYSELVREATVADVRCAAACATPAGVTQLLQLFPEIRNERFIVGRTLLAKSPTHALRHRLGRPGPSDAQLRRAELTLVSLVECAVAPAAPGVMETAMREAVVTLNSVFGPGDASLQLRAEERDRLLAFLREIAGAAGLEGATAERATTEGRTW